MFKYHWLIITLTVLVVGCYFAPVGVVSAAEGETASEETENPQGAGVIILMVGLVAIGGVGAYYASQQSSSTQES